MPGASAQVASGGTCSGLGTSTGAVPSGTPDRFWLVAPADWQNPQADGGDCRTTFPAHCPGLVCALSEVHAGASLTLKCNEFLDGATVHPVDSTTVTIQGRRDNNDFGSTGGTPIWTQTYTTCPETGTANSWTVFCTSDGTSGGTPWYGVVRIWVRVVAVVATVTQYDITTEAAPGVGAVHARNVGIYRCNPRPTLLDAGASPLNPWVGGDSIGLRVAVDSMSEIAQTTGFQRLNCAPSPDHDNAAVQLGTGTSTFTTTFQGSASDYQTGCTVKSQVVLNRKSAIALYSTTDYAIWDQTSPPSGVTFPSALIASFTSNGLNRIMTPSGTCTVTETGQLVSVLNRGETGLFGGATCTWANARGEAPPNNAPARAWIQRAAQWRQTDDFLSSDVLFDSLARVPSSHQARFSGCGAGAPPPGGVGCATVTTGLGYQKTVEVFGSTARTDSVLYGWGNSTGRTDVSATYFLGTPTPTAGITNAKTAGGANVSAFTIGADEQHVSIRDTRNAAGNLKAGAPFSCFRTRPDNVDESSVGVGTTDAGGDTPDFIFSVLAPAGTWTLTCSTTHQGNAVATGVYRIQFFFVSAFTADKQITLLWNVTANQTNPANLTVNFSMRFAFYDTLSDSVKCSFPDDVVRAHAFSWNATEARFSDVLVNRTIMTQAQALQGAPASCTWYLVFDAPMRNLSRGAMGYATLNFTGAPFVGSEAYIAQRPVVGTMEIADTLVGSVTLGDGFLMLAWFFLFLWTANRRYILPAIVAFVGIVEPLVASGIGVAFAGTAVLFLFMLLLHVVIEWRNSYREDAKRGRMSDRTLWQQNR